MLSLVSTGLAVGIQQASVIWGISLGWVGRLYGKRKMDKLDKLILQTVRRARTLLMFR
jgi:hypothetical protein